MKSLAVFLFLSFAISAFAGGEYNPRITLAKICKTFSADYHKTRCFDAIENVSIQREAIGLCSGWSEVHQMLRCLGL